MLKSTKKPITIFIKVFLFITTLVIVNESRGGGGGNHNGNGNNGNHLETGTEIMGIITGTIIITLDIIPSPLALGIIIHNQFRIMVAALIILIPGVVRADQAKYLLMAV